MGTWMSHLRIAEKLLDSIEGLDPEMFTIGSIGPDSGLPDEKWENFDPPKKVSHFEYRQDGSDCADLDFYRQHLEGVSPQDRRKYSFLLGYFFHLITDNLWLVKVWRPHKARYPDWLERDREEFNRETKRDWYGLDFVYLRDHPESLFHRVFVGAKYDENYLDFMSAAAFAHQLDYIQTFYQRRDEAVSQLYERDFIYLTEAQMDAFVDESAEALMWVYETVLVGKGDVRGSRTVLDILDF
jgi:hypothetical protein